VEIKRLGASQKGQSAVEFMVNYGWAIVLIIAVGAGLWQMGVLKMGESPSDVIESEGFHLIQFLPEHSHLEHHPDPMGGRCGYELVWVNRAGSKIAIDDFHETYLFGECSTAGHNLITWFPASIEGSQIVESGGFIRISYSSGLCPCGVAELAFNGEPPPYPWATNITFRYVKIPGDVQHTDKGTLSGKTS